jgi:hypothetical protein
MDPIDPAIDQQPITPPECLLPLPPSDALVATRIALQRIAVDTISPARREATGKIGLRATAGGFGTPLFGDERKVVVAGTWLVRKAHGEVESRTPIEGIDTQSAAFLADWYAFGANQLLELRTSAGAGAEPSMIQLWPEHFDIALELGSEAAGKRANYGFSPGDEDHPEPYLYVGPWIAPETGPLWNATGFPGAELGYSELLAAPGPVQAARAFLRTRFDALTSPA